MTLTLNANHSHLTFWSNVSFRFLTSFQQLFQQVKKFSTVINRFFNSFPQPTTNTTCLLFVKLHKKYHKILCNLPTLQIPLQGVQWTHKVKHSNTSATPLFLASVLPFWEGVNLDRNNAQLKPTGGRPQQPFSPLESTRGHASPNRP